MRNFNFKDGEYNIHDVVSGVVTANGGKGTYLTLENGQEAFAYFGGLRPGTKVLCSVRKLPTEKLKMSVTIDSVLYA